MGEAVPRDREPAEIDTSVAHASRVYDFFLGGTTNFEVDRGAWPRPSAATTSPVPT